MNDPEGVAAEDYSRPCPGCSGPVSIGDPVVGVRLPGAALCWWHRACRKRRLAELVERAEPIVQVPKGAWRFGKRQGFAVCRRCGKPVAHGSWVSAAPGFYGTVRHVKCPGGAA